MEESLVSLKKTLADKESELLLKRKDLKETKAEKAAVEAYLLDIKPGCDFITENFVYREGRRSSETEALIQATQLLKGTPAYTAAVAAQELEDLGPCEQKCVEQGREHAICKACLNDVTVPGYCAGHPNTLSCA